MIKTGIYKIWINNSNKIYIGSTIRNLNRRKNNHLCQLKKNKHKNLQLQLDFNKYGKASFNFEIIEEVKNFEIIIKKENNWYYNFLKQGYELYNYYPPEVNPFLGRKHSQETKLKMSEARKKENLSQETRQKMSKAKIGKKLSKETREKMSKVKMGKNHPMYGKHHSEEAKLKMSEIHKGKKLSKETKEKIGKIHKGKVISRETREKMSKAHKRKNFKNNIIKKT